MKVSKQQWDEEYASGRWDFLSSADEQTRQACIAAFIASYTPGEVIDLGCGPGDLLSWLKPGSVTHYTGVDVSEVALAKVADQSFPVDRVAMSLTDYTPPARDIGTIVASEVLYFVDEPASHVKRIVDACASVGAVVISLVAPNERKPNWERASNRVWAQFDNLGWDCHQSVRVENYARGTGWDLRFYLLDAKVVGDAD
ncbi:MAG: class I SAM-dependent methyltransferase [Hyphomicrobiales bacterium]|nr:class I SAM-dependent methyltransferase [Hyphomicrobiales bacterium]